MQNMYTTMLKSAETLFAFVEQVLAKKPKLQPQLIRLSIIAMMLTSTPTAAQQTCDLDDYSGNRVVWLNINGTITNYEVSNGTSSFVDNGDGTAVLSGIYEDVNNSNNKFDMTINLINKRNWSQWSALGRSYKNGGGGNHTTWDYFEVDNNNSTLTGLGGLAGVNLTITHRPTDYTYGFQVGHGANDKNSAYGTSGWFGISGSWSGHGDINADLNNCNQCNNVTTPGEIAGNEFNCESYDPAPITSLSLPTGGSGNIEYVWLMNSVPSTNGATMIQGANGPTYDPGYLTQTTYFRRCARRTGCSSYPGESNWICKVVGNITCPAGSNSFEAHADVLVNNNGVTNPSNLLGAMDGTLAEFYDGGDYVVIDLEHELSAGDQVCIYWKARNYNSSYSGDAELDIYEYVNGSYVFNETIETGEKTQLTYSCITLNNTTKTLKIKNPGQNPDSEIDNLIYCYCTTPCIVDVDAGPDQVTCGQDVTLTASVSGQDTCTNQVCCPDELLVEWNMDSCLSCYPESHDYTEFTPDIQATCLNVSAQNLSSTNGHSCIDGVNGTRRALCISDGNTFYLNATLTPNIGETGMLSGLNFWVNNPLNVLQMPPCGTWVNGGNIPTYTIKVKKNGSTIYTETRNLGNVWQNEIFDFTGMPEFYFTGATDFEVRLYTNSISGYHMFDLDEFKMFGHACGDASYSDVSYLWSTGDTTASINVNQTGQYIVTVTDCNGCSASDTVDVNADFITASVVAVTDATCHGYSDGSIDISVSGGTMPYSFNWSNGATTEDLSGISAGTYSVIVMDANGCVDTLANILVGEPTMLTASCQATDALCNGSADGSVDLTVGDGTPPYTYLWNNGATTEDLSGVTAGSYSVVVTDANGCTADCQATVNEPAPVGITINTTSVSCNGYSDGAIDITVSGGTPAYTFQWSNGSTTEDLMNIPAGSYSVVVTDANGCTASTSNIVITEPSLLTASCQATDALCNGSADGSVDLTVGGGTPPYTYLWNNGATTEDLSGVTAGSYSVIVTDANGCTADCQATVNEPAPLAIIINTTPVSCNGYSDGAIDITVSGGTPAYTFQWSNGATTEDLMNIPAGSYSVVVTDANGCTASTSNIVITEPSLLTASCQATDALCNGSAGGSVDLTVGGGTPPYTYLWNNGATTEDLSGVTAGSYSVVVTDANGCTADCQATVNEPAPIGITINTTSVSCNGYSDGAIDITVSGGTPAYTFQWSNGATTEDLNGIPAGSYSVVVTDANGCTASTSNIVIIEPSALNASTVSTPALCNGSSDGSIDLTVGGGTPPYTFLWSNGATSEDISGLAAGMYTVTITDANGCTENEHANVSEPTALQLSIIGTDATCNGYADGAANLTVSGGTPPYTYLWNNGATTEDLNGIIAGSYSVVVTDANACSAGDQVTINEPAALSGNLTVTDVNCHNGSDGMISSIVGGGTPAYSYLWSNGATTANIQNLSAGLYTLTVTDANGCTLEFTAQVSEPGPIVVVPSKVNVTCFGGNDGSIDLNVSGGTPPYIYLWSNGATTEDISGLTAGSYSVTVTDANNCMYMAFVSISEPTQILIADLVTHVTCHGYTDGSINIMVMGGTPPYTYLWSNGATTEDLNNIGAGNYSVTVTDAVGCTAQDSYVVNEPPALNAQFNVTPVTCFGGSDGAIDLTVNGGTPVYTFQWSNGATTEDLNNIPAGSYSVVITDANGCTATSSNIVVGGPSELTANCNGTDANCYLSNDGSVNLTVNGGTAPYTYLWSNGATTEDLSGLAAGTYTVTVTDANGCVANCSATVNEPAALSIGINVTPVSCNGYSDGAINITVSGGTPAYSFLWNNGATTEDLSGIPAGTYSVLVTDANGCTATTSSITVTEPSALTASCSGTDANCFGANDGSVDLTVGGGTPPYTYSWSNGETSEDINNLGAGNYNVIVTDANGCTAVCNAQISQPPALSVTAQSGNVDCFGGNDGYIDITVLGGTAPYTYNWNNGATTEDLYNLTAGTYTVSVSDANNCTSSGSTISVTITEPASALALSAVVTNVSCNGYADGSVDATVSGGTAPYTYSWNNGTTTEDISNLTAGSYTLNVTDANGCTAAITRVVTEPSALSSGVVALDANCFDACDGSLDLTVNGGTPPYSFSWSNGAITEDINGLCAGTYAVIITDANGCTTADQGTVGQPDSMSFTHATVDVTCHDALNGTASVTANGGTPPYSYLWSTGETTQSISGLGKGTYPVTITDANGCMISDTAAVIVDGPNPLVMSLTDSARICLLTTGLQPYPHGTIMSNQWNGVTISAVAGMGGADVVTVFNSNLVGTPDPDLEVGIGNLLTIPEDSIDNNNDGLIDNPDDNQFGGLMIFEFDELVRVNSFTFVDQDINTLPTVTAFDSTGAVILQVLVPNMGDGSVQTVAMNVTGVKRLELFSITSYAVTNFDIDCGVVQGGCIDGSADLTVSGGVAPYTFLWSNGATTEDLSGVPCATYTVTVTDANGCTMTRSVTIDPNTAQITCAIIPQNANACGGSGTATVLNVQGGLAPYTYVWNTHPVQYGPTATGLAAGTYEVIITDVNGCSVVESVTLDADPEINASISTLAASCFTSNDGTFNINITEGVGPFTYLWSDGATVGSRSDLGRGVHAVTITDANGCSRVYQQWINSPSRIRAGGITRKVTCAGGNDGQFEVIVYGGTAPYSFLWNDGSTLQNRYNLTKGVYTVTITDANGCDLTITKWVGQRYYISVSGNQTNVSQPGAADGSATAAGSGGQAPYSYVWNTVPPQYGATATGLAEGLYNVRVTDNRGCERVKTYNIVAGNGNNKIEEVAMGNTFDLTAHPNPGQGNLNVNIESTFTGNASVTMFDILGKTVYNEDTKMFAGENFRTYDFTDLHAGVYMLRVQIGNTVQTIRVIIE